MFTRVWQPDEWSLFMLKCWRLWVVERKFDQHSCWGLSTSPCPGFIGSGRGWSRVWWKNPPLSLLLKVPLSPFVTPGIEMCFFVRYLVLFALLWKTPHPFCICLYISTYLYSNLSCLMLRWQYPPSLLSRATSPPLVPLGIAMSLFSYFPVITSLRSGLWR